MAETRNPASTDRDGEGDHKMLTPRSSGDTELLPRLRTRSFEGTNAVHARCQNVYRRPACARNLETKRLTDRYLSSRSKV